MISTMKKGMYIFLKFIHSVKKRLIQTQMKFLCEQKLSLKMDWIWTFFFINHFILKNQHGFVI